MVLPNDSYINLAASLLALAAALAPFLSRKRSKSGAELFKKLHPNQLIGIVHNQDTFKKNRKLEQGTVAPLRCLKKLFSFSQSNELVLAHHLPKKNPIDVTMATKDLNWTA